jgi:FAD/FMN-containing dehydrogenase
MSKVSYYLQDHLSGEVMDSTDARRYFSTDASVFTITPTLAVYPRNEADIRKTARFTWQLAERGRLLPITARGSGTDQTGAALGTGIIMALPAHMHRILELDSRGGKVLVEPGLNYGKLQQTLMTHGHFIPAAPSSMEYSTVGGAVANNASGDRSFKYGDTRLYVESLRVVLANGEVITTKPLAKRELSKKLGLATLEGEVYRRVDALIEENEKLITGLKLNVTKNSAGYDIWDLTPLFVGSEGTLGIISEISFRTIPYNPSKTLLLGTFDDITSIAEAVRELRSMSELPSSIELVDKGVFELLHETHPNLLKDPLLNPYPNFVLLVEFDDINERSQKRDAKKAQKILTQYAKAIKIATTSETQLEFHRIRQSVAAIINQNRGNLRALPIIEDGIVPPESLADYLDGIYQMLAKNHIKTAVWGHVGDANLIIQPYLDLSQVGDRQTIFRLLEEYTALITRLGGSTSAGHGDGRLRGPYLEKIYGSEIYDLFQKVKQIFDPYGTMNPGVKMNVGVDDIKALLRHDYDVGAGYEHLPMR